MGGRTSATLLAALTVGCGRKSADPGAVKPSAEQELASAINEAITASFLREAADLAQVPGSSFYRRLREKFGRLAR